MPGIALGYSSWLFCISSRSSSVVCRTNNPLKLALFKPCKGSASIAKLFPPPAAPPYSTSRSDEDKKSVCGPLLGAKTMFCSSSIGISRIIGLTGTTLVCFFLTGVAADTFFFELLDFFKRFFEPSGKVAFN